MCVLVSVSHQIHALTCAENAMMTSNRPSLTLEGPRGELYSHSSMKSGILRRRTNLTSRTSRSARTSFVDLCVPITVHYGVSLSHLRPSCRSRNSRFGSQKLKDRTNFGGVGGSLLAIQALRRRVKPGRCEYDTWNVFRGSST